MFSDAVNLCCIFQMGHVPGKGLGKNLQGISTPVEAVLRKGRGAIGLYGSEKSDRAKQDFPAQPDSDEEEEKLFVQKLQQWKKGDVCICWFFVQYSLLNSF